METRDQRKSEGRQPLRVEEFGIASPEKASIISIESRSCHYVVLQLHVRTFACGPLPAETGSAISACGSPLDAGCLCAQNGNVRSFRLLMGSFPT